MKMIVVMCWISVVSQTGVWAQPPDSLWSRTFGGDSTDQAYSVRQTSDGGYILAGWTQSLATGDYNLWLIKTDAYGDSMWARALGGAGDDRGVSVVEVSDGYVVAGRTSSFPVSNENVYLVKTNFSGDTLWTRVVGGALAERAYCVRPTTDGGLIVAGNKGTSTASDFWLIKTDASGDSTWSRTYGMASVEDWCNAVRQTSDGGYVLAGYRGDAAWIIKTDASGNTLWNRGFNGAVWNASFRDVEQTADGGYILGGFKYTEPNNAVMWLVKTDSNGDSLWTRAFDNPSYGPNQGYSVLQAFDGGYVIAGYTQEWDSNWWIIKTDANGDSVWSLAFGGTSNESAYSVQQTADSGYILTGYTLSYGAGSYDAWLVKLGTLRPDVLVIPATLDFGTVFVEDSLDLPMVIRSTGNTDLTVTELTGAGDFHTDFAGPLILVPGDSLEVTVTFAPTQPGPQTDTLWVDSDALLGRVGVNVSGNGIVNSAETAQRQPKGLVLTAYPNPFNSTITIAYDLPVPGSVCVSVLDLLGKEAITLNSGITQAGSHEVSFDTSDFASGIYFVRLKAGHHVQTSKIVLLK